MIKISIECNQNRSNCINRHTV